MLPKLKIGRYLDVNQIRQALIAAWLSYPYPAPNSYVVIGLKYRGVWFHIFYIGDFDTNLWNVWNYADLSEWVLCLLFDSSKVHLEFISHKRQICIVHKASALLRSEPCIWMLQRIEFLFKLQGKKRTRRHCVHSKHRYIE